MIKTLATAATGLEAQNANIERISNDLANVNTDAYKKSRTEFNELMVETIKDPGQQIGASSQTPVGIQKGMGVKVGANYKIFEQGPAKITGNQLDLMIEGKGFFPIQKGAEVVYTRNGAFQRDSNGKMTLSDGTAIIPQINIPANAIAVNIKTNGEVIATLPNAAEQTLGQIQTATFANEQGLLSLGNGYYKPSLASGAPIQGLPGEDGRGALNAGSLEGSNVNVAQSMVEMIGTQRAYEMGTKVMGVADQMLNATVNIK